LGPAQAGIIRFPAMLAKEMLSPYLRLAKLELDIAPVSLRGFAFSRRVVDLEKYEDGGNHCF